MRKGAILLVMALLLTMIVPAWAEQTEDDLFVYDTENLLTEDEWLELELLAEAEEIRCGRRTCLYGVTVTDELGTQVAYLTIAGMLVQKRRAKGNG